MGDSEPVDSSSEGGFTDDSSIPDAADVCVKKLILNCNIGVLSKRIIVGLPCCVDHARRWMLLCS